MGADQGQLALVDSSAAGGALSVSASDGALALAEREES